MHQSIKIKSLILLILSSISIGVGILLAKAPPQSNYSHPLPPCPNSPNCVRLEVPLTADSATVLLQAEAILEEMGVHSFNRASGSNLMNAVFRIPVFGWLDDFTLIVHARHDGSVLYIRSASRVGYYDFGVNKRRVQKFLRILQSKLTL